MSLPAFGVNRFDSLMGVPWKHRGRDPKYGLDCYGLLLHIYGALGRPLPDYAYPADTMEQGRFIAENYHEIWDKVSGEVRPGDVVLMYMFDPAPNHVGIYLGEAAGAGWVLHMTKDGAVKEQLKRIWKRVAGIYRLKECS